MSTVLDAARQNPYLLLYAYLAAANLTGFVVTALDKLRAKRGTWRTRERTLVLFSVFGGGVGTLLACYLFRHKTKHHRLLAGIWCFTVLWTAAMTALFLWLHLR